MHVVDTNVGASANQTVWFDNTLCFDQTRTGMTLATMPWCDLRFPAGPCQMVVSGIVGDVPAPTALFMGLYVSSFATGGSIAFGIGRRAQTGPLGTLVSNSLIGFGANYSYVLDSTSYGGYYLTGTGAQVNAISLTGAIANLGGAYHLVGRFRSADGSVASNATSLKVLNNMTQTSYSATGYWVATTPPTNKPIGSPNAWTVVDLGQINFPPQALGGLADLTQLFSTPMVQWNDTASALFLANWQCLIPVDTQTLSGTIYNPTNSGAGTLATQWLWT